MTQYMKDTPFTVYKNTTCSIYKKGIKTYFLCASPNPPAPIHNNSVPQAIIYLYNFIYNRHKNMKYLNIEDLQMHVF